jgi:hypothetical protein
MKTAIIILCLALVGCSTTGQRVLTAHEVGIIPVDCLNRKELTSYLERQIQVGYEIKTSDSQINVIKHKLWEIRTLCSLS